MRPDESFIITTCLISMITVRLLMLFFEELSLLKFGIPNKPFFDTLLYFLNSRQALDVCEKNFPIDESSVSFGYFNRSQHGL